MGRKKIRCWLVGYLFHAVSFAQFAYQIDSSLPVEVDGNRLNMPWAGGLNSAQYNTIDLNNDRTEDLVVFDRTAGKVLTYLFRNGRHEYAPQYESLFPPEVAHWLLLRDFNCDGRKDIFTSDPFGIRVFVNTTRPGQPLSWRPYNNGTPLFTRGFVTNINLKVNETDIPAIDDIDGDGDLDILNFRFVGISTVEFHRNLSKERTGTCDSLQMQRETQNYGGFEDCTCGDMAFGRRCAQPGGGRTQHAGGKSMLTLDMDNDGDRELVFSGEDCLNLYALENRGTAAQALFESFTNFPPTQPVALRQFPGAFFEDVDGDARKDLIVSPVQYARGFNVIDFRNSSVLYRNSGSNTQPQFALVKTNFLQDEMIDVGDYSAPAFFDFEGDGDEDLFVGFYANASMRGGIILFLNNGSAGTAAFSLAANDFAGLSFQGLYNIKPMFSDLNGDGRTDLAFTATSAQNGQTHLYFLPNQTKGILNVSGGSIQNTGFRLGFAENVALVDVDVNGLPDILLGRSNGALQFWRNIGTPESPQFTLANGAFLGLGVSTSRQNLACAAGDLDADGSSDLVVCDQSGNLMIYPDFRSGTTEPVTQWLFHNNEPVVRFNLGGRSLPAIARIFPDARPALMAGNTLGGLYVFRPTASDPFLAEPDIRLYPNPVRPDETLFIRVDRNADVQFFTLLGQAASGVFSVNAHQPLPLQGRPLASGLYIVRVTVRGQHFSRRVVVRP
jgi:hypothetical protein